MPQVNDATARKACLVQEKILSEIAGGVYPADLEKETFGIVNAVKDSVKVAGVGRVDTDKLKDKPITDGAQRLEIRYMVKRCLDSQTPNLNPCTDGENGLNPWKYAYPTMNAPLYYEFTLSMGDFRSLCEGRTEHFRMLQREAYLSLMRQMGARYASQMIAEVGKYFHPSDCTLAVDSAAAPKTLSLLDSTFKPQPMGLFPLFQEYKRAGITERPFVVGGDHLDAWNFSRTIFAGNTEGYDPNRVRNDRAYADYQVDQAFADGAFHLLSWAPGTVFPMEFFKYIGEFEYFSDTQTRRKFNLGAAVGAGDLFVDNSIAVVECGEEIQMIYKYFIHSDLFFIPDDAISEACGQCSTMILNWLTDCGELNCNILDGFAVPVP